MRPTPQLRTGTSGRTQLAGKLCEDVLVATDAVRVRTRIRTRIRWGTEHREQTEDGSRGQTLQNRQEALAAGEAGCRVDTDLPDADLCPSQPRKGMTGLTAQQGDRAQARLVGLVPPDRPASHHKPDQAALAGKRHQQRRGDAQPPHDVRREQRRGCDVGQEHRRPGTQDGPDADGVAPGEPLRGRRSVLVRLRRSVLARLRRGGHHVEHRRSGKVSEQ